MEVKKKRKLVYFAIALFFNLAGVEYAIILPTIWLYLRGEFHAENYMMGLVMTSYYASGLISAPILGRLTDLYPSKTKVLVFVGILFEMVGSFMYFFGFSAWFLVSARLVAGIGTGLYSVMFTVVVRTTTEKERTNTLSMFSASRMLGIVLGPVFNIFISEVHLTMGRFRVDKYTLPGIFMAGVWLLYMILVFVIYSDFLKEEIDELLREDKPATELDNINTESDQSTSSGSIRDSNANIGNNTKEKTETYDVASSGALANYEMIEYGDKELLVQSDDKNEMKNEGENCVNKKKMGQTSDVKITWKRLYHDYMREEVVALMFCYYVAYFNQLALETMVTPISDTMIGWKDKENGYLFIGAGIEILLVFWLLTKLTKCYSDRTLLIMALIVELTVAIILFVALPNSPKRDETNMSWFLTGVALNVFGLPFLVSCSNSLFSKLTPRETQGFSQGLLRILNNLACVMGPLWIGGSLHIPYVMSGLLGALCLICLVMFALSYKYLADPSRVSKKQQYSPNDKQTISKKHES